MAENYTAKQAIRILKEGTDVEAIRNIAGRFPLFALQAVQLNEAGVAIIEAMPDWMTARKINSFLYKGGNDETGEAEDNYDEETPNKSKKPKDEEKKSKRGRKAKKEEPEDDDEDEDEDEEEEAPKKSKKAKSKKSKDDDDDDDFDFN